MLKTILTGGFLAGYRTYIFGGLAALTPVLHYLAGDIGLADLLAQGDTIMTGLGLMSLRASVTPILGLLSKVAKSME
jgi:hypothetical protein